VPRLVPGPEKAGAGNKTQGWCWWVAGVLRASRWSSALPCFDIANCDLKMAAKKLSGLDVFAHEWFEQGDNLFLLMARQLGNGIEETTGFAHGAGAALLG
jgi:hypothetical protein